jgi:hypothetical protein
MPNLITKTKEEKLMAIPTTDVILVVPQVAATLLRDAKLYRKVVPTKMVKMDFPFAIESPEGTVTGNAGDYLAMDSKGGFYPVSAEVFEETYRPYRERKVPTEPKKPRKPREPKEQPV